ncbi:hypothetical protein MJL81_33650, partial [Salmonella enterica subsp. enterica serovar Anatum]|nr:hypothetical protein [Salmonella enterica subsp. enterica serovar Anatum]
DGRPDKPYHGKIGFVSPTAEFTPKTVETPDLRTDLVYRLRIIITDLSTPDRAFPQTPAALRGHLRGAGWRQLLAGVNSIFSG